MTQHTKPKDERLAHAFDAKPSKSFRSLSVEEQAAIEEGLRGESEPADRRAHEEAPAPAL